MHILLEPKKTCQVVGLLGNKKNRRCIVKNFKFENKRKIYVVASLVLIVVAVLSLFSSFTFSWLMDESVTSNGEPNIAFIGDLELDVTTNFKFKNLAFAPDTVYTLDQDMQDIATYIKTNNSHDIDGAYVRIKFETTRRNSGATTYTDNLDLLNLYFDGNLTTSTSYATSSKQKWYYNINDNYYYYLWGVYDDNVMFNKGYKTSNTMTNEVANADVLITFTIDAIQRQYEASSMAWTTAPQIFKDMVADESRYIYQVLPTT